MALTNHFQLFIHYMDQVVQLGLLLTNNGWVEIHDGSDAKLHDGIAQGQIPDLPAPTPSNEFLLAFEVPMYCVVCHYPEGAGWCAEQETMPTGT